MGGPPNPWSLVCTFKDMRPPLLFHLAKDEESSGFPFSKTCESSDNLGTFSLDALCVVLGNHASTSNDNKFGV